MKRKNTLNESQDQKIEPMEGGEREDSLDATSKKNSPLGRRRFLTAGMGAAALALTVPKVLAQQQQGMQQPGAGQGQQAPPAKAQTTANPNTSPPFSEPKAVTAQLYGGQSTLDLTLNTDMFEWRFVCGGTESSTAADLPVPIFNGHIPGPTMIVDPGTTMNITLRNNMPIKSPWTKDDCAHAEAHPANTPDVGPPPPGCFMHTNLHTHGFMVSPCSLDNKGSLHCGAYNIDGTNPPLTSSSDDVLVNIYPQQQNKYCIVLPGFHDPGTYWYHSHLHGASGYQVSSGMAGAIIIREPPKEQLVQQDLDKVWVMQEVWLFNEANLPPVPTIYPGTTGGVGSPSTGILINGLCQPTLQVKTGETQRWRFINATATPRGFAKLRLIKCSNNDCSGNPPSGTNVPMYLIAVDSISFHGFPPQPVEQHLMAPGNRADFLINIQEPGMYVLYKDAFPTDATSISSTNYVVASKQSTQVLAYIEVVGPNFKEKIPETIPGERKFYLQPIAKVSVDKYGKPLTRTVKFQNPKPGQFMINDAFYPNNKDIEVGLNTAEEWTLQNISDPNTTGVNPHPFHIHVNPFQVIGRTIDFETNNPKLDPKDPCNWMWMDTLAIPSPTALTSPGQIKIRSRFLVYQGEFVSHCHILVHEDIGMMVNIKIKDDGSGVGPCKPLSQPTANAVACVNNTKKDC